MTLSSYTKTSHIDVAYTVSTVDGILLDCTATSYMFSDHHIFTSYQPLVNSNCHKMT